MIKEEKGLSRNCWRDYKKVHVGSNYSRIKVRKEMKRITKIMMMKK